MKQKVISLMLVFAFLLSLWVMPKNQVDAAAVATADNYTKLTADTEITLNGEDLIVDLAGYNLTVKGMGKVYGFDTANEDLIWVVLISGVRGR